MIGQAKAITPVQYENNLSGKDGAFYAFFDPSETGWRNRICVYSAAPPKGRSTINAAEDVIDSICKQESMHWHDVVFCDLQTSIGYTQLPGFYMFDALVLSAEPRQSFRKKMLSGNAEEWHDMECPRIVFDTFNHLIGDFHGLKDVISKERPAYKDRSYEYVAEEMGWALDHVEWLDGLYREYFAEHASRILTPDQALAKGYRFAPECVHAEMPDPDKCDREHVVVDLRNSHLLGQHNWPARGTVFERPHPLSLWKLRADWVTY